VQEVQNIQEKLIKTSQNYKERYHFYYPATGHTFLEDIKDSIYQRLYD
jgi:hypothetical protein